MAHEERHLQEFGVCNSHPARSANGSTSSSSSSSGKQEEDASTNAHVGNGISVHVEKVGKAGFDGSAFGRSSSCNEEHNSYYTSNNGGAKDGYHEVDDGHREAGRRSVDDTEGAYAAVGDGDVSSLASAAAFSSPLRLGARTRRSDSGGSGRDGGGGGKRSEAGGGRSGGGNGLKRKRRKDDFYGEGYFRWTDELMEQQLPPDLESTFATLLFELGLKHSSPKVLMKLMPDTEKLTTEHIKSHLQKYRLHYARSKEEFREFYDLRLRDKFRQFCSGEGWKSLQPRSGGGGGVDGDGAGGSEEVEEALRGILEAHNMQVIHELSALLVKEQRHLQRTLQDHVAAQAKLQQQISEEITTKDASQSQSHPPT